MAEERLDHDKFVLFLQSNRPKARGLLQLIIDPDNSSKLISDSYCLAVSLTVGKEVKRFSLSETLKARDLFTPQHSLFTTHELISHSVAETLEDAFLERVAQQLRLFKLELFWEPKDMRFNQVCTSAGLGQSTCYIRLEAAQSPLGSGRYVSQPYKAITDNAVRLSEFWDSHTLGRAWNDCKVSRIQFREWT